MSLRLTMTSTESIRVYSWKFFECFAMSVRISSTLRSASCGFIWYSHFGRILAERWFRKLLNWGWVYWKGRRHEFRLVKEFYWLYFESFMAVGLAWCREGESFLLNDILSRASVFCYAKSNLGKEDSNFSLM